VAAALKDFRLLYSNAHAYNKPGSQIYKDVDKLSKLTEDLFAITVKRSKNMPGVQKSLQQHLEELLDVVTTATDQE
jgi:hypothetical protein